MEIPKLIESNVKHYLTHSLHQCYENRIKRQSSIINVILSLIYTTILLSTVYYIKYSKKSTSKENYEKQLQEHTYIMNKLRQIQSTSHESLLTDLPRI